MEKRSQVGLFWIAITVVVLMTAGAILVGYGARMVQYANRVAKEAAQMALTEELVSLLEKHRVEHGRYPESLHELPVTYPDGGDRKSLDEIEYRTDGDHYRFRVQRASTKEWLEACGPKPTQD